METGGDPVKTTRLPWIWKYKARTQGDNLWAGRGPLRLPASWRRKEPLGGQGSSPSPRILEEEGGGGKPMPCFFSSCSTSSGREHLLETPPFLEANAHCIGTPALPVLFWGLSDHSCLLSVPRASPPMVLCRHLRRLRLYSHDTHAEPEGLAGSGLWSSWIRPDLQPPLLLHWAC